MSAYDDDLALPHVMFCHDCKSVWDLEYEDDGETIARGTDKECPECGADGVCQLRKAQAAYESPEDRADARADHERDEAIDRELMERAR